MSAPEGRTLWPIPKSWSWTAIGEVTEVIRGASPRPKGDPRYFGGPIPWISIADLTRQPGKFLSRTREGVTEAGAELSRRIPAGELILSNSATVCVPKILQVEGCIHDGFVAFPNLKQSVDLNLAFYWFECVRPTIIQENRQGVTQVNLNTGIVREIHFPLPPLAEQKRIVAKIEELFSELEAGEASLRKARRQLGVYRQSLLKQAFEGKLTQKWRTQNPDKLESPASLLARIQSERLSRYQAHLNDWERTGKGAKPNKPAPIESFPASEIVGNFSLPTGWLVVGYGGLCSVIRNGISQKPTGESGHKIARISAVRPMAFDYDDYRFIDCEDDFAADFTLATGDLVFTRYNGARRFVGVCAQFKGHEPRLYPDKLIRTRPDLPLLEPRYLEIALNCGLSRAWLETKIRTTAGQSGVSGGDVKAMPVPLCTLPEQQEIVRLLDAQFEAIERNEQELDAALQRSEALRQAILKKAFSGRLVPQDPADEPASTLLARLRSERAAAPTTKRKSALS